MITYIALLGLALAQDEGGNDAHGRALVPSDGDPIDPLWGFRPERQLAGSFGFGGTLEYADSPLVLVTEEEDSTTSEPVLDNLMGLTLGGQYAIHERVAVGLSVPAWFAAKGFDGTSAPAFGDLRVSAPITLVVPGEQGEGFGLGLVPMFDLPTGGAQRWLGDSGPGGGGVVAASFRAGDLMVAGDLGAMTSSKIDDMNLTGGPHLLADLSVAYLLAEQTALRVETRIDPGFAKNEVPKADSPAEIGLNVRHRTGEDGLSFVGGATTSLTPGAGAARFRVFLGVGFTGAKKWIHDTDGDGLMDPDDTCVLEPETVNQWKDTDGCPDKLANLVVTVKDVDGILVGATIKSGETVLGTTGGDGSIALKDQMPETAFSLVASFDKHKPNAAEAVTLAEGDQSRTLTLPLVPGTLVVKAVDKKTKAPLEGTLKFSTKAAPEDSAFAAEGARVELPRGAFDGYVGAEGYKLVPFSAVVKSGETSEVVVELEKSLVKVKANEIVILEQVHFAKAKADILPESDLLLTEVATVLIANPQIKKVEVQGHTDSDGNDAYNLDLSQRRVDSVVKFLVAKGVDASRLVAKGYGETQPAVPNDTKANKALNRRVQFMITEQEAVYKDVPADQANPPTP